MSEKPRRLNRCDFLRLTGLTEGASVLAVSGAHRLSLF
jgi:hypothetical protein